MHRRTPGLDRPGRWLLPLPLALPLPTALVDGLLGSGSCDGGALRAAERAEPHHHGGARGADPKGGSGEDVKGLSRSRRSSEDSLRPQLAGWILGAMIVVSGPVCD